MKLGFKNFAYYLIIPAFLTMIFNNFYKNHLILSNLLFYLVLLLFFFFCSRHDIKKDFKDFKNNFKEYLTIILKWVLVGFVLMMLSNYVIQFFIENLPSNEISNRMLIKKNPFLYLIYLLIIAPLLEEYVFRFSFKSIKNYYLYALVTSVLFTSLHLLSINNLQEVWFFISYFILSFSFANVYFKTKNYFASSFAHIIHNLLCVIIILIG